MPRRMSGCDSRQPHQPSLVSFGSANQFHRPCASLRDRVSKTQFARGSTETACQFSMGSWQTSNALALQAS